MSLRSVGLLIVGFIIVLFVALNWGAMTTPTEIRLLVASVQAPLGLMLLGLMVLLSVAFVAFALYLQGAALLDARRHARELAAQRELADQAETSRLTALHTYLEQEITRLAATAENQSREILARVDRAESGLREASADTRIDQLAAAINTLNGDLHARIDRLEIGLRESMTAKG